MVQMSLSALLLRQSKFNCFNFGSPGSKLREFRAPLFLFAKGRLIKFKFLTNLRVLYNNKNTGRILVIVP